MAVCSPEPEADAAQNVCSPGGPVGAPPEIATVRDPERIEVEVAHLVVRHAVEVGVDVGGLRDPDEDVPGGLDGEPHVAEDPLREHPVPARVRLEQVDALRGDRVGVGLEEPGGRGQEAVVIAVRPVGPEQRPAGGEQPDREQRDEAAQDDEQNPSHGPVRPARRRRCRAVGGHVRDGQRNLNPS